MRCRARSSSRGGPLSTTTRASRPMAPNRASTRSRDMTLVTSNASARSRGRLEPSSGKIPAFVVACGSQGARNGVGSLRAVRVAAFDLGSNSFHLIVAEVRAEGSFEPIITEKEMLRLGDLVGRHGRIPDDAADAAVAVVRRFRQLADAAGADEVVACGTSALRRAANGGGGGGRLAAPAGGGGGGGKGDPESR